MIDHISQAISSNLVLRGAINENERDLYSYGAFLLISNAMTLVTALLIGLVSHRFVETLMFITSFVVLRSFTGGYHSKTFFKCYVYFLGIIAIHILILNLSQIIPFWLIRCYCLGAVLLSGFVIRVMAPVDHENAPIHATERPAYKRIALGLLIVETICSLLFLILPSHFLLAVSVSTSLFVVSILLIIGDKNRKSKISNQY